MPRPLFDIQQYELRGITPDVFTKKQKAALNRSLNRAHGQIDWTAQLLGYNGPNYWGKTGFKADGTFTWTGLPSTMAEKRQLQATTYGVYNKDQSYEYWPAPFNRSEIGASGDGVFHMFETGSITSLAPFGQGEKCDYFYDPTVYVGGVYVIDSEIEFYNPNDTEDLIKTETFSEGDVLWTRLYILDLTVNDIGIRKLGSEADFFYLKVRRWHDISDWNLRTITSQFLGAWGNKGASVALDAQFDALNLHGFDEKLHLENLKGNRENITLEKLFASVGGKLTEWSAYNNLNLGFKINDSEIFYPVPQGDFELIEFFEFEDCDIRIKVKQLIEEDQTAGIDCCEVNNEEYDRLRGAYSGPSTVNNDVYDPFNPIIPEQCVNAVDGEWSITGAPPQSDLYCGTIEGDINEDRQKGIGSFEFEVEPKTDCALDRLCVEWIFDSELDNGSYDDVYIFPGSIEPEINCCLADNEETPPPYLGPNVADSFEFTGELIDDPKNCEQAMIGGDYPEDYTCDPDDPNKKMPSDHAPVPGPWITFDDGEYDDHPYPNPDIGVESVCLKDGDFVSFDDGVYDEPREPDCDVPENCAVLDGDEIWTYAYFPDYEDCVCSTECCLIDNFPYVDMLAYQGPDIADGGVREIECCVTDNGIIGHGPFEGTWDTAPNYTDCGPDSGVNPWYCCDPLDNQEYVYRESPYYGPNHVNGCLMDSRIEKVEILGREISKKALEMPEDYDWPPIYTDNGVLNVDEYDIENRDPDCLPYYCHLDNDRYSISGLSYEYTINDCIMLQSDKIEDTCDDPAPPRPPGEPLTGENIVVTYSTFLVECSSCWEECSSCDDFGPLCPVDTIYARVKLFSEPIPYKMHPGLENAFTPLRLWKPPTLNVTDTVRNHDTDMYNYLVADENRGANPEDAYRSYVRLPLEYARGGPEWAKASSVCENMLYWSATSSAVYTQSVESADPRPMIYQEIINKDIDESEIIYYEDYIYSNVYEDVSGATTQEGFTESLLTYEAPVSGPYDLFTTSQYDPLDIRRVGPYGEWRGEYYRFSNKPGRFSGFISRDLQKGILEIIKPNERPVYDMSQIKYPVTQFPEDGIEQQMKNYVVSYAYFAADFSASDEPVFEPEQEYCHRNPVSTCSTTTLEGDCVSTQSRRTTNYLLHPVA